MLVSWEKHHCRDTGHEFTVSTLWCAEKTTLLPPKKAAMITFCYLIPSISTRRTLLFLTNNRNKSKLYFWRVWRHVPPPASPPPLLTSKADDLPKAMFWLILCNIFRWPPLCTLNCKHVTVITEDSTENWQGITNWLMEVEREGN